MKYGAEMKIIVGYDGSDSAKAALADLPRAGLPKAVEAIVVAIAAEPSLPPPPPSAYELLSTYEDALAGSQTTEGDEAVERALKVAVAGSEQVRSAFPSWNVRAESGPGWPPTHLIETAKGWKANLLIIGARRQRLLERLVHRGVSQELVAEAMCSVRIGRQHAARKEGAITIVVGIDGSSNSQSAVREVARRKWPAGTCARVVAAAQPVALAAAARATATATSWSGQAPITESALSESNADAAADELRASGLNVVRVLKQGDPKHALVDEAQRFGADSIFVGAPRFDWMKRLLVGSVSLWVARHAPCSVEVVRAPRC